MSIVAEDIDEVGQRAAFNPQPAMPISDSARSVATFEFAIRSAIWNWLEPFTGLLKLLPF